LIGLSYSEALNTDDEEAIELMENSLALEKLRNKTDD
jgi:hypothetical protein